MLQQIREKRFTKWLSSSTNEQKTGMKYFWIDVRNANTSLLFFTTSYFPRSLLALTTSYSFCVCVCLCATLAWLIWLFSRHEAFGEGKELCDKHIARRITYPCKREKKRRRKYQRILSFHLYFGYCYLHSTCFSCS